MKTAIKVVIGIAVVGLLLIIVGLAMVKFDITQISAIFNEDVDYVEINKSTEYECTKIQVDAHNNIVKLVKSTDEKTNITYFESEKNIITYLEENGTISIVSKMEKQHWFIPSFSWRATSKTITIALPESFKGIIDIKTSNGNITVENLGVIESLTLISSNAIITAKDTTVEGNVSLKSSNGKIIVTNLVCKDIAMETENGKIQTTNLKAEKVAGESSNGDINYANTLSDNITAKTSNGKITMTIKGQYPDYEVDVSTSNGSVKVNNIKVSNQIINLGAAKKAKAKTSNGSIVIEFI